jgi:hypothetical protein
MTAPKSKPDRRADYVPTGASGPVANIVAQLDGGPYYMISEVSEITGTPVTTLRRWYKRGPEMGGTKGPSLVHKHLGITIYLYTDEDIQEIRDRKASPTTENRTQQ